MDKTKKLFHAVVVLGMAAALGACTSDTNPPDDAAAAQDSNTTKDVAVADVSTPVDAGGDGFVAWLGC